MGDGKAPMKETTTSFKYFNIYFYGTCMDNCDIFMELLNACGILWNFQVMLHVH